MYMCIYVYMYMYILGVQWQKEECVLSSLQSEALFECKTAEKVQELIRNNARVDDRRGNQATPLMVQVTHHC